MIMKRLFFTAMMVAASVGLLNAQTAQKQVVEEGGTGPYKSEVVGDTSCPRFTIYRPQNLKEVVAKNGALPVIVYANGACFNNNVEMRLLLSEVASYGYLAAAIGPYDEEDVMAPVKGGKLADPPQQVKEILHQANPNVSYASWAIRFTASLPNVMVVLSGMSNMEQMEDNLSFMRQLQPLNDEEQKVLESARKALSQFDGIACTACHYCTPGCPMDIHIPEIFAVMNVYKMYGNLIEARNEYKWRPGGEKASACIQCGQCEDACPQHLPIISLLEEVVETLEE